MVECNHARSIQIEDVREQGVKGNSWISEGGTNRRLKKNASNELNN
jgi:hypothetical protein